jgi:NodT family efflux transporter outer membrane factor (OMF) lipoprotein
MGKEGKSIGSPGVPRRALPALAVLATLAAGCATVGPDYRKPDVPVPAAWNLGRAPDNTVTAASAGDISRWWERLGDKALAGLIERALSEGTDLRTARAKLSEARIRRGLAGADRFPTVTASASAGRSKSSSETGSGTTQSLYNAGFDSAWEADIFGGIRRGVEAAQADLEAAEADLHATQVSIAAEVALNYVEARSFQEKLAIAGENLASQAETYRITDWRAQAGLASSLDVEQARSNLEQTRGQIPALEAGLAEAEHRLSVLLGRAPGAVRDTLAAPGEVPAVPGALAVGVPADALRNRPDIRAAERRLAAETARTGQAAAARYPGLSLNASIGVEALSLGALDAGSAVARSVLASLAGTVFDGGRLRMQVEIQDSIQEQALIAYEAAVLTALEEVENALVSLSGNRERQAALRAAAEAARNAALLARNRYEAGLIDFQTVLDTERTRLSAEESLAGAKADVAAALVKLYKALGGGWTRTVPGIAGRREEERT